jgi:hypothetical protein|tara:strand:- start:165693 stop:166733 length:1041 start_codon:yes stop_codon:yes gene_type:complete
MQRRIGFISLGAVLLALPGCAAGGTPEGSGLATHLVAGNDLPVTETPLVQDDGRLRFVIVGDRTGGHRPGIFSRAMQQINLLQPEFVISVGDHIEGYTEDTAEIDRRWDEVETAIDTLEMPFFHVVGNHDISNLSMREIWYRRLGRDYYHFIYKGVLFIALNTEDPPASGSERRKLASMADPEDLKRVFAAMQGDPDAAEALFSREPRLGELAKKLSGSERIGISQAQLDYVAEALAQNPDPRWTFVLMHRPAWRTNSPEFARIEAMLEGRPYTVLAGHYHSYAHEQRLGRDYIITGTTGGTQQANPDSPGTMDHVIQVTMTEDGPRMANITLDGLSGKEGPQQTE